MVGLTVLAKHLSKAETVCVVVGLSALVLVVGLTAFCARIAPELRTRSRSRSASRMMARQLKNSVTSANARTAVAALRMQRDDDLQSLQSAAARADLLGRIERIRVRRAKLSAASRPATGLELLKRRLQRQAPEPVTTVAN